MVKNWVSYVDKITKSATKEINLKWIVTKNDVHHCRIAS